MIQVFDFLSTFFKMHPNQIMQYRASWMTYWTSYQFMTYHIKMFKCPQKRYDILQWEPEPVKGYLKDILYKMLKITHLSSRMKMIMHWQKDIQTLGERGNKVTNLANCIITNWLTFIYLFVLACISQSRILMACRMFIRVLLSFNTVKVKIASTSIMARLFMFTLPMIKHKTEYTMPLQSATAVITILLIRVAFAW